MRSLAHALALLAGAAVLAGCQGNSPSTPTTGSGAGAAPLTPTYSFHPGGESLVAQFHLTIDPVALTASAEPVASRNGATQPPQAISYDLDIANFLRPDSFEIGSVTRDPEGDLEVQFIHRHPFRAPDFAAPISGQNRADLGYTGRLLILAEQTNQNFFGTVLTDPTLVKNPDGYARPGDLLAQQGLLNTVFPYILLADDAEDNRFIAADGVGAPQSNGGDVRGTFDVIEGGWQRSNIGTGTGWTGFDYVHGGQGVTNSFSLYSSALASGPVQLDVAVLIKYTDPRGRGGRTLRFPPIAPDVTEFAYRLPYSNVDVSKVTRSTTTAIPIATTVGATATVSFDVRDWDAQAIEGPNPDLSGEFDVSLIEPGAAGYPTTDIHVPAINATPAPILPTGVGTGIAGDELGFQGSITKNIPGGTGIVWGMIRVIDASDDDDDSAYHFGVDPNTIVPDAGRALESRSYQAVPIEIGGTLNPPVITAVSPSGVAGCPAAQATFSATVSNSPTSWSWNFGGGATPNTSTQASPMVTLGAAGSYNGSVTATNGAGSSAPFNFSFSVVAGGGAFHLLDSPTGGEGYYPCVKVYNGNPVVASVRFGGGTNDLNIAFANVAAPTGPGQWSGYSITNFAAGAAAIDASCDMELLNGRLAILFKNDATNRLNIAVATVTAPAIPTAAQWNIHEVDPIRVVFPITPALNVHDNRWVIAYTDTPAKDMYFGISASDFPTATAQWAVHMAEDNLTTARGEYADILSYNDGTNGPRVYIAHRDDPSYHPRISKALTNVPTSASDWFHFNLNSNFGGRGNSMVQTTRAGQPSLALAELNFGLSGTFGPGMKLHLSTVPNPTTSANFIRLDLEPVNGSTGNMHGTDIVLHNGNLLIAFFDTVSGNTGQLGIATATIAEPSTPADFVITHPDTSNTLNGFWPQIAILSNGAPAVVERYGAFNTGAGYGPRFHTLGCN